ncbi:MAG TPA: hypothetical protein VGE93_21410 [Bryobacteraceae bacterium]
MRLHRVTAEEYYVKVPVTAAVMAGEPDENGRYSLDGDKVFEAAVALGRDDSEWILEEQTIEVHPIQKAPDSTQRASEENR